MRKKIIIITGFFLVVFIISFAGKCVYSALPTGTGVSSGKLRIFVTNTTYLGNLGGAAGADAICNNPDLNKPSTGFYRALIMDSTRNSTADPNWALKPQTSYYRSSDMVLIGTTDLNARITTLINVISTSAVAAWTGLNSSWGVSSSNCANWTTNSAIQGMASMTNDGSFPSNSSSQVCSTSHHLICVEQP